MKKLILTSNENELLNRIKGANKGRTGIWKIPNLFIPIAAIVVALIITASFSSHNKELMVYLNLVVNGSIPLIAINQISSMGVVIIDHNKQKEKQYGLGEDAVQLRIKFFYFSLAVLVASVIAYCYQVVYSPFDNYVNIITTLIISICLVLGSTYISKRLFLLQENFIANTFDQEIAEDMKNKGHGKDWGK